MMTLLLNETTQIWMHICSLVLWILTILLITYLFIKQHKKSGQKKYFVMIPNSEMGYSDVPCVNYILDDNPNSSSTIQCRGINRKGEIINSLIIPKKIDGQDKIIDYLCIVNVDKDTQFQQVLLLTIRDSNSRNLSSTACNLSIIFIISISFKLLVHQQSDTHRFLPESYPPAARPSLTLWLPLSYHHPAPGWSYIATKARA